MRKTIQFAFFFLFFLTGSLQAQDFLKGNDLSNIQVDKLSDTEINKIKSQMQSNNLLIGQIESLALSKGMSASEVSKLKQRLGNSVEVGNNDDSAGNKNDLGRKQDKIVNNKSKDIYKSILFGSELFDNPTLNFEPNLSLATPVNYIVGTGDELQVSVYGVQEFSASLPVSIEGKISIQHVGQIPVAGMTIEAATAKIKGSISRIYSTVASGQSQVSVSLGRIRTIKITLIGSKQPGNYSISSLATVYNALFLGGGPGDNGSYRNIELIRDNKLYKTIDIYKFLVNGNQSDNVGLKDNDVIRIPAFTKRVTVEGQVKRPGIFELKSGETFKDVLAFASGFNDLAYTASVSVLQKTDKEFRVRDVKSNEYSSYKPNSGDVITITKILDRFENRITINGAVFRPNTYSFYEGMRIADLLNRADGLKEDAYTKRATIVRLKDDLTTEVSNVDLVKVLEGSQDANILLKKEDVVTVYSILDFVEDFKVIINGEVRKPGEYQFNDNLTLNDLLLQAGGLTGSASKKVEIARMIISDQALDNSANKVELINIEISADSNEQLKNVELKPFDVVNIRRMILYERPSSVTVSGAVNYPGSYVLLKKSDKVLDIIQRAGGLKADGNIFGVKIKRPIEQKQIEELENVDFNLGKGDTIKQKLTNKLKYELKYATVPIDWEKVQKSPNSIANVSLQAGDELEVAFNNESVKVTGNVLLTSEIPYIAGKGFNYYLNAVGGLDNKGWKKNSYIIYPNGKASVMGNFWFFRSSPRVIPGSQIVVPEKPTEKRLKTTEFISIASVVASLAGVIIGILTAVK